MDIRNGWENLNNGQRRTRLNKCVVRDSSKKVFKNPFSFLHKIVLRVYDYITFRTYTTKDFCQPQVKFSPLIKQIPQLKNVSPKKCRI